MKLFFAIQKTGFSAIRKFLEPSMDEESSGQVGGGGVGSRRAHLCFCLCNSCVIEQGNVNNSKE